MGQTPPISQTQDKAGHASKHQTPPWLYKRIGRYQLQALLGGGSNGKVFRAEDLQLARHIALKVFSIAPSADGSATTVEQAVREAKMAAGLEHPHIVHVYEVNETSQVCYIAMELVEGGSLRDLVRSGGPMEYRRACQLVAEAGEALAFAHDRGVIHRDVKPANLMLSGGGRCKLADFGLAIFNSRFTTEGTHGTAGTPQFIAPELIKGEPASQRSDIYSLGATLWYLLTANPPFVAESVPELLDKQLNDPLPDLSKLRPDVPPTLVRTLAKAMEKEPASRYENAEQFASVLRMHTIPVGGSASSLANLAFLNTPAEPVPVRRAILWGGIVAIICVAIMAIPVYWIAGGWLHPTHVPPRTPVDFVATARPNPAAAPVKTPATLPAIVIPPGTVLAATDSDTLSRLATTDDPRHPTQVTVEGVVAAIQASKHVKYFRISFAKGDFGCVYKPELVPVLQEKFGGVDGLGLAGKKIRVTGNVDIYKDHPEIKIEAADQINLVKP